MSSISTLSRGVQSGGVRAIAVPRRKWKTRVILPLAIIGVLGGLAAYAGRDVVFPPMDVQVVPAIVRGLNGTSGVMSAAESVTVQAPGWVEADPYATYVGSLTDGVLKEVLVLEGQRVEAQQVVARMNPEEAAIDVALRQAELKSAEAKLAAAHRTWDNPVERTRAVAANDAMLAQAKAELEELRKTINAEEARTEEIAAEQKRTAKLAETGAVTSLEVIRIRKRLDAQEAVLAATRARVPVIEAKVRQLEAELVAAKENLRLRIEEARDLEEAKAGVLQAKAAADQAVLKLTRMDIRTPVAGVVATRLKEPGDALMFSSNMANPTQVLKIYDPAKLQVRVDVPLSEAAKVGVEMRAQVVVGVLPDRTFTGKVTRVVNEADVQKNTLQVKVRIDDPTSELKPEMLARVKFVAAPEAVAGGSMPADATSQRVFAPENLVKHDGPHGRVWVVERARGGDIGFARKRHVMTTRRVVDGWVEVEEGLKPGDLLIATSIEKLREGTKVRITGEASSADEANASKHSTANK